MAGSERTLMRVQAGSGLLFSIFLTTHLVNQMLAAWGAETYDSAQRTLRRGYQWAPVEIGLVLAPLIVHVTTGVLRMLRRRERSAPRSVSRPLRAQRISAIVLLIFFVGHIAATRGASLAFGVYPEFSGVAFTLRWVPAYFWPYYAVFGLAGIVHVVLGIRTALPIIGAHRFPWPRRTAVVSAVCFAAGVMLLAGMLGFGGVLHDVGHPEQAQYASLLRRLGIAR